MSPTPVSALPMPTHHSARTRLFARLLPLLLATPVAALADIQEDSFITDLPLVLSASRLSQPQRDTPGTVTVIDRATIQRSGARSVAELLRGVPGFQIGYRTGYFPLVTYHGLSDEAPRRLLVRIDGRSAYSPYLISGTEWHMLSLDLDDIERIEVFRGSNAAAFGSQAFMGVVNIVTRSAAETRGVGVKLAQGNNTIKDRATTIGLAQGPLSVRLSAGVEGDDGLRDLHDRYKRTRADLRAELQIDQANRLEVHAGSVRLRGGLGEPGDLANPIRTLRQTSNFGQLRWLWEPNATDSLSVTYYRQEERGRDAFTVSTALNLTPGQLARLSAQEKQLVGALLGLLGQIDTRVAYSNGVSREDLEIEHVFSASDALRMVWGLGTRSDEIRAPGIFTIDRIRYRNSRAFGSVEWHPSEAWLLNASLMMEKGSYVGTLTSPRIAANYHLSDQHTLRASYGHGYRRPTPFERQADTRLSDIGSGLLLRQLFQPSPDLEAERISTFDLGYRGEFKALDAMLDIRLFEERLANMTRRDENTPGSLQQNLTLPGVGSIPLPPILELLPDTTRPVRFYSDDKARIRGIEIESSWRPHRKLLLGATYTHLNIRSPNVRAERSAPRHSGSLLGSWQMTERWNFTVAHHRVGQMSWFRAGRSILPAYNRTDLRLAHRFDLRDASGEFAIVARNLGRRHADFKGDLITPREWFATVSMSF